MLERELQNKVLALEKALKNNNNFLNAIASKVCNRDIKKVVLLKCFIDNNKDYIGIILLIDNIESLIKIEF